MVGLAPPPPPSHPVDFCIESTREAENRDEPKATIRRGRVDASPAIAVRRCSVKSLRARLRAPRRAPMGSRGEAFFRTGGRIREERVRSSRFSWPWRLADDDGGSSVERLSKSVLDPCCLNHCIISTCCSMSKQYSTRPLGRSPASLESCSPQEVLSISRTPTGQLRLKLVEIGLGHGWVVAAGAGGISRMCSKNRILGREVVGNRKKHVLGQRNSGCLVAMDREGRSTRGIKSGRIGSGLEGYLLERDDEGAESHPSRPPRIGEEKVGRCGAEHDRSCCRRDVVAPGRRGPRPMEKKSRPSLNDSCGACRSRARPNCHQVVSWCLSTCRESPPGGKNTA